MFPRTQLCPYCTVAASDLGSKELGAVATDFVVVVATNRVRALSFNNENMIIMEVSMESVIRL